MWTNIDGACDCGQISFDANIETGNVVINLRIGAVKQRAHLEPKNQGFLPAAQP